MGNAIDLLKNPEKYPDRLRSFPLDKVVKRFLVDIDQVSENSEWTPEIEAKIRELEVKIHEQKQNISRLLADLTRHHKKLTRRTLALAQLTDTLNSLEGEVKEMKETELS